MHILVIGINYAPEETSVAPFTTGLCQHLVACGHHVSVVTAFPYYPEWRIHDPYRGHIRLREKIGGVDVRRVLHYVPRRPRRLWERLLHDVTFSAHALVAACGVRNVDVIVCSSPPPFAPLAAWIHSRARRVPYGVKVTDLATEVAISTGMLAAGPLVHLARGLERFGFSGARGVSVLSPGFKARLVELGIQADRVFVVPDWADTVQIRPLARDNPFRQALGYGPSDFVALHAGNLGLKQKLETVIDAATLSGQRGLPIKWLLVGDGEERDRLQRLAQQRSLGNVQFLSLVPREQLPEVLALANALLLVQRAAVTTSVIPSKLLMYMAAGRPVIASINPSSEAARRITDAGCGVLVAPEDPEALILAAMRLRELGRDGDQMGQQGRAYVEAHFSKEAVLRQYDRFLQTAFDVPCPTPR